LARADCDNPAALRSLIISLAKNDSGLAAGSIMTHLAPLLTQLACHLAQRHPVTKIETCQRIPKRELAQKLDEVLPSDGLFCRLQPLVERSSGNAVRATRLAVADRLG
jgi:hypothetical protein